MRLDNTHRRALSVWLAGVHGALAVLWLGPWHGAPAPDRLSPLQRFNELVPWSVLFAVVAITLFVCAARARYVHWAHAIGFVVMGVFCALATLSALPVWGQTVGSFVGAVLGGGIAGVHFLMQRSYLWTMGR